ncbi:hypothetical protein BpHYR1_049999 [Brachionus plicatilis]|uniref:Uncharacterized protein n=1 Tax=Brachionus plicatilis TaxID=10195 RepID=A0A3M7S910_BRAPC|nr:hypothetical protein BpHYR1_049999 [Brachionus plicatilis]
MIQYFFVNFRFVHKIFVQILICRTRHTTEIPIAAFTSLLLLVRLEDKTQHFKLKCSITACHITTTLKRERRREKTKHIGDVNALQNAVAERTPLALILRFS